MQAEAKQIIRLVGVVDVFLYFVQQVLVEVAGEEAGCVQGAMFVKAGATEEFQELLQRTQHARWPQGQRPGQ